MTAIQLSREELSFAFLMQSHNAVCEPLFDLAMAAIKVKNPTDWKEKTCSCFSAALRQHVKDHLETNRPLTDIYALCKLIRCRIHDVASFYGGKLSDPREKERLSLQVQGVETARNFAFHGELVYVREVRSNIILLMSVLTTLCSKGGPWWDELCRLLYYTESLQASLLPDKPEFEYILSASVIGRVLLHRSFREFEQRFSHKFSKSKHVGNHSSVESGEDEGAREPLMLCFQDLIKRIRKDICQSRKVGNRENSAPTSSEKHKLVLTCNNVLQARNRFAHKQQLSLTEIKDALCHIRCLLVTFGLNYENTTSATEELSSIAYGDRNYCCTLKGGHNSSDFNHDLRKRLLHPRGQHFVGRTRERLSVESILKRQVSHERRAVLIFGPAGIGKSYLAAEIAHSLRKTYKIQAWLSCSSPIDLEQEHRSENGMIANMSKGIASLPEKSSQDVMFCEKAEKELIKLVVYDDVCSSTVDVVCHLIYRNLPSHSVIITTRSTSVSTNFQRVLTSLHVVELKQFSVTESFELLNHKGKVPMNVDPSTIESVLSGILGNLPLCVNIYTSLITFSKRANDQNNLLKLAMDEASVSASWQKIEECFGDRYHVRGLTGVVESAASYLKDHPLAVLLLAKLCSADCEGIPWTVVSILKSSKKYSLMDNITTWPKNLLCNILKVADWLFSSHGQDVLQMCRNMLEELGLITWEESMSTVHIHRLTLGSAQEMLNEKHFFLEDLVRSVAPHLEEHTAKSETNIICQGIFSQLLYQLVFRGQELINIPRDNFQRGLAEEAFGVFRVLVQLLESGKFMTLKVLMTTPELFHLKYKLVGTALRFASLAHTVNPFKNELVSSLQTLRAFVSNTGVIEQFDWRYCLYFGTFLESFDFHNEVQLCYGTALEKVKNLLGSGSIHAAYIHCKIAQDLQSSKGSYARKSYLKEASRTCPRLLNEPTIDDIKLEIRSLLGNSLSFLQHLDHPGTMGHINMQFKLISWVSLIFFKIFDSATERGKIRRETLEVVLYLIVLLQQRQRLCLTKLNSDSLGKSEEDAKIVKLWDFLVCEVKLEFKLWMYLAKTGRMLRVVARTAWAFDVNKILRVDREVISAFFWVTETFVVYCCIASWQVGHYSLGLHILRPLKTAKDANTPSGKTTTDTPTAEKHTRMEGFVFTDAVLVILEAFSALHEGNNIKKALVCLLNALKTIILNYNVLGQLEVLLQIILDHIVCLCCLLSETITKEVPRMLQALANYKLYSDNHRSSIQQSVQQVTEQLKLQEEALSTLGNNFLKGRDLVHAGDHLSAHRYFLTCWRTLQGVLSSRAERSPQDTKQKLPKEIDLVFASIQLALCKHLRNIYSLKGNDVVAEWFQKATICCTKTAGWHFLTAKCGAEYVEFLMKRNRWSEAMEQCCLAERGLMEEFGDDYKEWLPGAPNIALLREGIEMHMSNNSNASTQEEIRRAL